MTHDFGDSWGSPRRDAPTFALILVATVGQLLLAILAPDLPQFAGKAFGAPLRSSSTSPGTP